MTRKQTLFIAAAILLGACGPADAPETTATSTVEAAPEIGPEPVVEPVKLILPLPEGTSAAIAEADLGTRIATLADDAFEGRAPGTYGGEGAADWIASEMNRIGLKPGADGDWFQTVEMVETTLDESTSGLTISGAAEGDIVSTLGTDAVIWSKRQNATELSFEASELVFVGYGTVAPEYGWDDYKGQDMTGKTIVMLVNDPGYATADPALFKGQSMTYYGRWTYKFEEAARQNAAGAIVIHDTAPASYGWDVVANSWSGGQADLVRANGGADRAIMEGWISLDMAKRLFAEAGLDFEEQREAAKSADFSPVDMGELTASAALSQTIERKQSRNVVGVLPGTTRPDEYVLYTGHWDHLGKKTGEKAGEPGQDFYADQIFNGAVDNATGSAAILEIAEALAAEEHERSVMLLSVTLEESGLLGSAYYAENPIIPHNQVVAGINIDALTPVGRTRDIIVVGYGASQLEDRLKALTDSVGRVIVPDPTPQAGYFYRSDHVSLAKKGVPMLYADSGIDKLDGGIPAGRAFIDVQTAQRYHKPADEYNESWDLSGMVEDITLFYELGKGLANSEDWPEWYDGNEFKAIREASLADR